MSELGTDSSDDMKAPSLKTPSDLPMEVPKKLRILALHGYRQSGPTFRVKTGSFRKLVHKLAQFTYITAPHKVIPLEGSDTSADMDVQQMPDSAEQYGWWFNRDDKTFRGAREGGPAIGFEESVKFVESIFKKFGPFDGLLGFSQGACFVGLLCELKYRGLTNINFHFAVMASGFKSGSLPHLKYYGETLDMPTLHIIGENDVIIPKEMSLALKQEFDGDYHPVEVLHPGGHFLPASSAQKAEYVKFFKLMQSQLGNITKNKLRVH